MAYHFKAVMLIHLGKLVRADLGSVMTSITTVNTAWSTFAGLAEMIHTKHILALGINGRTGYLRVGTFGHEPLSVRTVESL